MDNPRIDKDLRAPPVDFSSQIAKVEVLLMVAGLTWKSPLIDQWLTQWLDCPNRHWCSWADLELIEERLCIEITDGGLGRD
ncbi:MAG: hypothetical protein AAF959_14160 [Cyanobacteria bacterium P01_D01_bin.56]